MEKLRYSKVFKDGVIALIFCTLLCLFIMIFAVISTIQYNKLISDMESIEATIVDIDLDIHVRGPDEQEIYITYIVDGKKYERELGSDTKASFSAGTLANYSVGDKIEIFYNPENPEMIASPRSNSVANVYFLGSTVFFVLMLALLGYLIKNRKKHLVTFKEYEKEKERVKRAKIEEKEQKRKLKAEKRKKHAKARKIIKIILIILGSIGCLFVLYMIFGLILIAIRG